MQLLHFSPAVSYLEAAHYRYRKKASHIVKNRYHIDSISEKGGKRPPKRGRPFFRVYPVHVPLTWGLGPGSRKSKFSPTPRRNSKCTCIAVSSSIQRVLQLWSNRAVRAWSTPSFFCLENAHPRPKIIIFPSARP